MTSLGLWTFERAMGRDNPAQCPTTPSASSGLATNSWLYVPLLHAAAGEMGPEAVMRWALIRMRPGGGTCATHTIAASCPVPVTTLTKALLTATKAAALPTGASVHIGWVARHLASTTTAIHHRPLPGSLSRVFWWPRFPRRASPRFRCLSTSA